MSSSKKRISIVTYSAIILTFLLTISFFTVFYIVINSTGKTEMSDLAQNYYHVLIIGKNQNEAFLKKVYEGAKKASFPYRTLVELYVPKSQAEDSSIQELFDYASFVNPDGIIACIDSTEEVVGNLLNFKDSQIPVVTTGQFAPNVNQICFIGNNYWKFGITIADETAALINSAGTAYIINTEYNKNINYSNIINSFQQTLTQYKDIDIKIINQLSSIQNITPDKNSVFVCFTEEDTINTAQMVSDFFNDSESKIIGYGSNEACQLFYDKGIINELLYIDPEQIGETAINELFEFKHKGYANSYISVDIIIQKEGE